MAEEVEERACIAPGELTPAEVVEQLERILASNRFSRAARMRRFLTYVVERKLEGEPPSKEQTLAIEVFDKTAKFDPRLDPIVRVEARRLRSRLTEYYAKEGVDDPIVIQLPLGGYEPEFELAGASEPPKVERKPAAKASADVDAETFQAVAVLPFTDMSAEGDNQHFCDGLTEELINALTRVDGLEVVARSSSFQFHGPAHDIRQVGKNLGVGTVLEGSVRRAEGKVRITAQLTNANNGFHLWSETYDAEADNVFEVQERIAKQIVGTLSGQRAELLSSTLTQRHSEQPAAYRSYLQGLYHLNEVNPQELSNANEAFEKAIEEDEEYAQAYAGLAMAHCKAAWLVIAKPAEVWPKAKQAAMKAAELDPKCAPAHVALGCAYCLCDWNWSAGEDEFRAAMEADPGEHKAPEWFALALLSPLGRFDEALEMALSVAERTGYSLYAQNHIGVVRYYGRDYEEAVQRHRDTLKIKSDFAPALWDLGRALVQQDELRDAEKALSQAVKISSRAPMFLGSLAACHALMGREDEAREALAELGKREKDEYVSPLAPAWIHIALGEHDEAFERLEEAADDRSSRIVALDVDPVYDDIREDERFAKLRTLVCLDLSDQD